MHEMLFYDFSIIPLLLRIAYKISHSETALCDQISSQRTNIMISKSYYSRYDAILATWYYGMLMRVKIFPVRVVSESTAYCPTHDRRVPVLTDLTATSIRRFRTLYCLRPSVNGDVRLIETAQTSTNKSVIVFDISVRKE